MASDHGGIGRRTGRRGLSAALLLAAGLALSSPDASAQTDAEKATARQLAQEGQDALRNEDFATASDRFARADALFHAPTLLLGLARAQTGLRRLVAAQETYRRILREPLAPGSPDAYSAAVEAAIAESAEVQKRLPFVIIRVEGGVQPRATLDGQPLAPAMWGVKRPIDPGKHVVRAGDYGYQPAEQEFESEEGELENVTLKLVQGTGSPPAGPYTGVGPAYPMIPRRSSGSGMRTAGFVVGGVGVVGLILGAITGGLAVGEKGTLDEDCDENSVCPPSSSGTITGYRVLGNVSTGAFIVGGLAAATGGLLLLLAPSPPDKTPATTTGLRLSIGPGGVAATGAF